MAVLVENPATAVELGVYAADPGQGGAAAEGILLELALAGGYLVRQLVGTTNDPDITVIVEAARCRLPGWPHSPADCKAEELATMGDCQAAHRWSKMEL